MLYEVVDFFIIRTFQFTRHVSAYAWNVLIIKNPLLHGAFVGLRTYDTTRCLVQPSRFLAVSYF
jgi:hypothetical protein